ncbi:xylose isomerase [Cephaloticoccus primus]|uniref:Xylose isomerase n=1 Tax=Cephaloticoccus primus TaxID=1548207 RepID=A0A139STB8_9BACT|nr:sugar phosphate isomerase/epimerase [Cephaloticoccus primus]KXU37710.1 xylose isomerase [Cephaloticoccus primus]
MKIQRLPLAAALSALLLCAALPTAMTREAKAQKESPIAVQMYTLRSMPTLEAQLAAVKAAGITAIEIFGNQGVSAHELKALVEKYGLKIVSAHVELSDLRENFGAQVAFNKTLGNHMLVVPALILSQMPNKDPAGWAEAGHYLGEMARRLEAEGLSLAYHNHSYELVDFDGKTGLEIMFAAAGPSLQAELDMSWVARAGYDPVEMLERFSGRVFAIHAKDRAPVGRADNHLGLATVGEGVLDWAAILPAAAQAGAQWYIIEHDLPRDPAAAVKAGAAYLRAQLSSTSLTK